MSPKKRDRCTVQSFSVKPEDKWILDILDEWSRRDRTSKSDLNVKALKFYIHQKWRGGGGNPQTALMQIRGEKPPINIEALETARLRKAITFLRFKARLSYDQIAKIVGMSHGFIYKLCKSLEFRPNFDGRKRPRKKRLSKAFKRNLNKYREKFDQWMNGKYKTIEEAFTW